MEDETKMNLFEIKDFSFQYPLATKSALKAINLTIQKGEFITLCGGSGSGKTTLMRHMKETLAPHGIVEGTILFEGKPIKELSLREQASKIGYVFQNPDHQIVTDKVWHELAFGLESLGYDTYDIRLKVCEMASFFGISHWFHKKVTDLSGGQKQLLNLAAIMAMQPEVILLDEPTAQLDPVSATNFLDTLKKINRDLGITIIVAEHRLEEVLPMSDRMIVMDEGYILVDKTPEESAKFLHHSGHYMFEGMPASMQVVSALDRSQYPLTIRAGRRWIEAYFEGKVLKQSALDLSYNPVFKDEMIKFKEVCFRYDKQGENVIQDLSFSIKKGEFYTLLGGNGTGKTTTLQLINGMLKAQYGKIEIQSKKIATLPQNPQALFVKKTVEEDLLDVLESHEVNGASIKGKLRKQGRPNKEIDKQRIINEMAKRVKIDTLLKSHPYDLSGGEQQRVALAKVLLLQPEVLLLDEPTKGLDAHFKKILAHILRDLTKDGITIVMVSHDLEFCAKYGDRCGMFFNGNMVSEAPRNAFFSQNNFYTTSTSRMTRKVFDNAVTIEEAVKLCRVNMNS